VGAEWAELAQVSGLAVGKGEWWAVVAANFYGVLHLLPGSSGAFAEAVRVPATACLDLK
jgi:threonine dehydrogenase-like Zn-dependent dehydrogenase